MICNKLAGCTCTVAPLWRGLGCRSLNSGGLIKLWRSQPFFRTFTTRTQETDCLKPDTATNQTKPPKSVPRANAFIWPFLLHSGKPRRYATNSSLQCPAMMRWGSPCPSLSHQAPGQNAARQGASVTLNTALGTREKRASEMWRVRLGGWALGANPSLGGWAGQRSSA